MKDTDRDDGGAGNPTNHRTTEKETNRMGARGSQGPNLAWKGPGLARGDAPGHSARRGGSEKS